jgi:predicted oxidoreductase
MMNGPESGVSAPAWLVCQQRGTSVTDVYIEDPEDYESRMSAIARMRAEVDRMVLQLEHMIQNAGADVADAARLRARYVERKIKSQFVLSAAIAIGVGLLIGATIAGLSARSRSLPPPRRNSRR